MKSSHLKSHKLLLSGVTTLAVLAGTLAPTAGGYAGQLYPEENDKSAPESLPAGVDLENAGQRASKVAPLWLKLGNASFEQKNYDEALSFYEKAADKGLEEAKLGLLRVADVYLAKEHYTDAFSCYEKANSRGTPGASEQLAKALDKLVLKGNDEYEKGHVTEAFDLYTQAAHYGSEGGKELVAELGVDLYNQGRSRKSGGVLCAGSPVWKRESQGEAGGFEASGNQASK